MQFHMLSVVVIVVLLQIKEFVPPFLAGNLLSGFHLGNIAWRNLQQGGKHISGYFVVIPEIKNAICIPCSQHDHCLSQVKARQEQMEKYLNVGRIW